MKRIEPFRIRNGQPRVSGGSESDSRVLWPETACPARPNSDFHQTWDQGIWPDCLD